MTNKELAEQLENWHTLVFGEPEVCREAARRLRELPDPTPAKPEYGWGDLAANLGIATEYLSTLTNWHRLPADDLVRGTCVRLMREKGMGCQVAESSVKVCADRPTEWFYRLWPQYEPDRREIRYASSEPAAYRDMLKHAGVIQ